MGAAAGTQTAVDRYWADHTVRAKHFRSARQSQRYLRQRFESYPLFRELMGLWGDHSGEAMLDYGCGPGNDLVGFLLYANPQHVIGIDVSPKALELAGHRLALHKIEQSRFRLIHAGDAEAAIPLDDGSVHYIHCAGVLQHVSDPAAVLGELRRVLAPGGRACVMVYNRDSIYFHLYTAYLRMIRDGSFAGLSVEEAFTRNTDGEACPIARCYRHAELAAVAAEAGFSAEYRGGYFAREELDWLKRYGEEALASPELAEEHKTFIRELEHDELGYPRFAGHYAGVGGVHRLRPA
jgi:ubiquinone/menaquinone biosynthesis C-methylase UbiE